MASIFVERLVIADIIWSAVGWAALIFVVSFVVSLLAVGTVLVGLPATYFLASHDRGFWTDRHPAVRWAGRMLKNGLGAVLVLLGLGLSLPGIPGQGLLTMLVGLLLIEFPGKRRLEKKIIGRPRILHSVNQLRHRFGRDPLVLDVEQAVTNSHEQQEHVQ